MALTRGKTFTDNEQVTSSKLHQLVDDATIDNGAIDNDALADEAVTNAKISTSAGIALSKIATTFGKLVGGGASSVAEEITVGSTLALTSSELNVAATAISSGYIADGAVVAAKLYSTLDLSGKTLTLPSAVVGYSNLVQAFPADVSAATAATGDYILIGDADDSENLKKITVQSVINFLSATATSTVAVTASTGAGTVQTFAHGLSAAPAVVRPVFICSGATGDIGFSQNDELDFAHTYNTGGGGETPSYSVVCDDTNIYVVHLGGSTPGTINKTTGAIAPLTLAEWSIKVYFRQ